MLFRSDFDQKRTILFGDDFEIGDIIWMGDQPKMSELAAQIGVTEVMPYSALTAYIADNKDRKLHFTPPYRGEKMIALSKLTAIPVEEVVNHASVELIKAVIALRELKSEEEIIEIEKACAIGYEMFTTVMRKCKAGVPEGELAGLAEGIEIGRAHV